MSFLVLAVKGLHCVNYMCVKNNTIYLFVPICLYNRLLSCILYSWKVSNDLLFSLWLVTNTRRTSLLCHSSFLRTCYFPRRKQHHSCSVAVPPRLCLGSGPPCRPENKVKAASPSCTDTSWFEHQFSIKKPANYGTESTLWNMIPTASYAMNTAKMIYTNNYIH